MEAGQAGADKADSGPLHFVRQGQAGVYAAGDQLQDEVQRLQDKGEAGKQPDQHAGAETCDHRD